MRKPPTRLQKTIGWLLSAFLLVVYFSPQAQLLRTLPDRLSVAVGQRAVLEAPFPLTVEAGEDVSAGASLDETLEESAGISTATISFLGLLPLREVEIDISDDLRLYPIPWCDSVPEEYRDTVNMPAFRAGDMSLAVVEARGHEKDTGGLTFSFGVLHQSGVLVEYRCDGLTAQAVWELVEETLAPASP